MLSKPEIALTLLLSAVSCGGETRVNEPTAEQAQKDKFEDPINRGKVLAVGRDPGILIMDISSKEKLQTAKAEAKQQGDNYLLALEDLYGHFPELADLVVRTRPMILGVANVEEGAAFMLERMGKKGEVEIPKGHKDALTLTLVDTDTGGADHIILLSTNALNNLASTVKALGHEFFHIKHADSVGGVRYGALLSEVRETEAYTANLACMRLILPSWIHRYDVGSEEVRQFQAEIADHEEMRGLYK